MIEIDGLKMREVVCDKCRNLIYYEKIVAGTIKCRCQRCGHLNGRDFQYWHEPAVLDKMKRLFAINKERGGEKTNAQRTTS